MIVRTKLGTTVDMENWTFQGNPKHYPVLDHLLDGETEVR